MKKRTLSDKLSASHGDDIRLKNELFSKLQETEDLKEYEILMKRYKEVCKLCEESKELMKGTLRNNL